MADRLAGKVALVTGASKGLGAGIARMFGAEGARVVVNYARSSAEAAEVVSDIISSGGEAIAVQADMSRPEDVEELVSETIAHFGAIDILVNNAGVYAFEPLEKLNVEIFRKHFDLNVLGYLLAIKEVAEHMKPGSSIINMSSTVTIFGPANASVYTASKGAIDGLTRSLSTELGPRGIRVNAIKPGVVDTEGVEAGGFLESEFGDRIRAATPLGRLGFPNDIAPAAVYLASDESSWMTGEFLVISGGQR